MKSLITIQAVFADCVSNPIAFASAHKANLASLLFLLKENRHRHFSKWAYDSSFRSNIFSPYVSTGFACLSLKSKSKTHLSPPETKKISHLCKRAYLKGYEAQASGAAVGLQAERASKCRIALQIEGRAKQSVRSFARKCFFLLFSKKEEKKTGFAFSVRAIKTSFLILLPILATAQTTSWAIASVSPSAYTSTIFTYIDKTLFENEGKVKIIKDTPEAITITFQATTTLNGFTKTGTKRVILETCISCFTFNGLTYCGIKYAGYCWLDRDIGATRVALGPKDSAGFGTRISTQNESKNSCPEGWAIPNRTQISAFFNAIIPGINMSAASCWVTKEQLYNNPLKFASFGERISSSYPNAWAIYIDDPYDWSVCTNEDVYGGCSQSIFRGASNSYVVSVRCVK